jgi:hypothetical protein
MIYLYYCSRIIGADTHLRQHSAMICPLNPACEATGPRGTLRPYTNRNVRFAKSHRKIGLGFLQAIAETRPQGCWHW